MKKIILNKDIETVYYKLANKNKLIIANNSDGDCYLLKQIATNKWIWISIYSTASIAPETEVIYKNMNEAIENLNGRTFHQIYEFDTWESAAIHLGLN